MVLAAQKTHNPLKPLYIGACRFLLARYRVLVFGSQNFYSDWNYKCGLYVRI